MNKSIHIIALILMLAITTVVHATDRKRVLCFGDSITDGHRGGSVPFTHLLYAFNQVVPQENRLPAAFIESFYEKQDLPAGFQKADTDPLYGGKRVIFRKVSKNTRVTIFQGRHEIIHEAALNWLSRQRKGRSAVWDMEASHHLKTTEDESRSGR